MIINTPILDHDLLGVRTASGGNYTAFINDPNKNFHLSTTISILCKKDGGNLICGQKTHTATF
jgi:hypothetical protein